MVFAGLNKGPRMPPQLQSNVAKPIVTAVRLCRTHLMNAAIFSAFLNLLYLAPSIYMLQVYDRVVPTRGSLTLLMLTIVFVASIATIAMLDVVRSRLLVRASIRIDRELAGPIINALLLRTTGDKRRTAALLREFDTFRQTITGVGVLAVFDLPWLPVYIIICGLVHWAIGLMALFGAMLLMLLTWFSERATKASIKGANEVANLAYLGLDISLSSAGAIRALGMRQSMVSRHWRERQAMSVMQAQSSMSGAGYVVVTRATRMMLQSLALGLGAFLAINQQISAGAIFAASLLIGRALSPIELVTAGWRSIIQARSAAQSINDLFDSTANYAEPTRLPDMRGDLEVQNIIVTTQARDRAILNNVSFKLDAGEMLGVVGPSGAGKSTLAKAIVGAEPLHQGSIRIDGAALGDWPEQQLYKGMGYVPQEPSLFRGTIKENIARFQTEFAEAGACDDMVVDAARACGAHDFILRLPNAYDTMLDFNGVGLSVGQAQRVAMARALFGKPSVLVLDEPNAALDAEGEGLLIGTLERLRADGVTIIVIAHRTTVLASVDKLLMLEGGRVRLFGSRNDVLMQLNGKPAEPAVPARAMTL